MFYRLQPAVPSTIGDDTTVRPPRVEGTLSYEIDNWFGDDLVPSHPCYLVTEKLADNLAGSDLEHVEIRDVGVTYGEAVHERLRRHGWNQFPKFRWFFPETPLIGQSRARAALLVFGGGVRDTIS